MLKDLGVDRVVRVVDEETSQVVVDAFERRSRGVGYSGETAETVAEAERLLDRGTVDGFASARDSLVVLPTGRRLRRPLVGDRHRRSRPVLVSKVIGVATASESRRRVRSLVPSTEHTPSEARRFTVRAPL